MPDEMPDLPDDVIHVKKQRSRTPSVSKVNLTGEAATKNEQKISKICSTIPNYFGS